MRKLLLFVLLVGSLSGFAQQIGINTVNPHASAALDVFDTAHGILIPRMNLAQRNRIQQPAEGLMVYQTDSIKGFWYYANQRWYNLIDQNNEPINSEIKRVKTQLYIKP